MDNNDPLYSIYDSKSKKKKIGDIVYYVIYATIFLLLGAMCFLIYKLVQYDFTGRM